MTQVLDFAGKPPKAADIKAKGYAGSVRYLAPPMGGKPNPKCATKPEVADDTAARLLMALVYEAGATWALGGAAAGHAAGAAAAAQAKALGAPAGAVIYMAMDFGATSAQMPVIAAALDGAKIELHNDGYRCGVYGSFDVVGTMIHDGHVEKGWQTVAWSGFYPKGHPKAGQHRTLQGTPGVALYQRLGQVNIDGTTCDVNDVWEDDWGGWNLAPAAAVKPSPIAPKPVATPVAPKPTPVVPKPVAPKPAPPLVVALAPVAKPLPTPPVSQEDDMRTSVTVAIDLSRKGSKAVAVPVAKVTGLTVVANKNWSVPNAKVAMATGNDGKTLVVVAEGDPGPVSVIVSYQA